MKLALTLAALACASASTLTTDTDSRSLPDRDKRLAFLARYLTAKSALTDAEYVIHYRDNSGGGVPGPSDYDVRAVLQVTRDVAPWRAGWEPCALSGKTFAVPAWARALLDRRTEWQHATAPGCFRDPRHPATVAYIFEPDRLVAYRSVSEASTDVTR